MKVKTTIDGLLNKSIWVEQPADGYRIAVDTMLLAAAVPAKAGDKVVDFGCGVGGAMLALAFRVPGVSVSGIEIQPELAALCAKNIERNSLKADLQVKQGDTTRLPAEMIGTFDHVMMNPPYHDVGRHDASLHVSKRMANTEEEGDLTLWVASAVKALKDGGALTLIHRADRLDEILFILKTFFGVVMVKPIAPKHGISPKRVIIRAEKGGEFTEITCLPFVLHNADGSYGGEAEGILREVKKLKF